MNYDNSAGCIQTYSGHMYSVIDPDPDKIKIQDIAVALGRTPRFGGHTLVPYSVVDHSYNVYDYVRGKTSDLNVQLAALLHDAHEAYLCDIPTPIKRLLPGYDMLEQINQAAVAKAFEFDPDLFHHPLVKEADTVLLATEKRDFIGPCEEEWAMDIAEPWDRKLTSYHRGTSELLFLRTFEGLQYERKTIEAAA